MEPRFYTITESCKDLWKSIPFYLKASFILRREATAYNKLRGESLIDL